MSEIFSQSISKCTGEGNLESYWSRSVSFTWLAREKAMTTILCTEISLSEVHKFMVIAVNDHNSIMKSAITQRLSTRLTKHAFVLTLSILPFYWIGWSQWRNNQESFFFPPSTDLRYFLINFPFPFLDKNTGRNLSSQLPLRAWKSPVHTQFKDSLLSVCDLGDPRTW